MAELARSASVPNSASQGQPASGEERRNTMPHQTHLTPQTSTATMFHRIPHQMVTKTLIAPSPCAFCQKFIWGVLKQAVYCAECKHTWHPECEQFAQNDCGLTSQMLAGALSVSDSSTPSPTPQRSPSLKKEKKPEIQVINGHVFRLTTYHGPVWCKHCNNFIWGFQKQGWKCQKCELDCHTKCLPLISTDCMFLTSGQLAVVENEVSDAALTQKAQERRTEEKSKKVVFNKKGRFRVKAKNPFSSGFSKGTNFSGPSPNDPETTTTSTEDSDKPTETSDEEEEEKKKVPLPPLNTDKELIDTLEREESFAKTFSAGVHVREKRESISDSSSLDQVHDDDFSEQSLDEFFIDEDRILGSGQFGVVKFAKHKKTGTPLAVKIIDKKKFWGRKNSTRHLKREIAIMSSIKHPNIIRLHAVIDHPTELYLFMELVEAGDLLAYVEKKGRLTEDEGKFLFHQLCVGVKYLHDSGVIHRDLKPENLLLLEEHGVKRVKLADFGFANIIGEKSFLQSVVGTPAYVAPEILKKTKGYQKSADMWSIGVIMYACLSGVFPFDDEEPVEDQIKAGKFTFPNEYWGKVSDKAIDLICNLLVVDPKNRLSIDEVLKHPWFQIKGQLSL